MFEGAFKYEGDLLKHYIRVNAWLPWCRRRLAAIRQGRTPKRMRRLRYFTFCAVGAIDVLMLDVARVIRRSSAGRFDTVVFFDRTPQDVAETQKRIPGAIGFPGDFVDTVLLDQLQPENQVEEVDPLSFETEEIDEASVHKKQNLASMQQGFIREFPFDVLNLDIEEFFFKPNDALPGKVVNALRKLFEWQRNPLRIPGKSPESLEGFTLMFTTQVGPPNLSDAYLDLLTSRLDRNIERDGEIADLLRARTGLDNTLVLRREHFEDFFTIAVPKVLAAILMEEDWHIDPELGVPIFQFQRPSADGPYTILHMAMEVRRNNPPRERRAPGEPSNEAQQAYGRVARAIVGSPPVTVAEAQLDSESLLASLGRIRARRRLFYPDQQ